MTNVWFDLAEVSVGQHWYWQIGAYPVHGQVLITSWIVLGIIAAIGFLGTQNLKTATNGPSAPEGVQNLTEYVTEFIRDLAKTQIGEEEYLKWVPFLGTIFLGTVLLGAIFLGTVFLTGTGLAVTEESATGGSIL